MNKDNKSITKEELERLTQFIKQIEPKDSKMFEKTKEHIENCQNLIDKKNL